MIPLSETPLIPGIFSVWGRLFGQHCFLNRLPRRSYAAGAQSRRFADRKCSRTEHPPSRESCRNRSARYRRLHPESAKNSRLQYAYGMTLKQWIFLFEQQSGRCAICRREKKLHVDHCHKSQKIRGLLCGSCNRGLGLFGDSPEILLSAERYLRHE